MNKETQIRDKDYLREMAKIVASKLPDNHGFILFAFPFGDDPGQRMIYVSNADRKDVINVLKEFIIKAGATEDWMKHLP